MAPSHDLKPQPNICNSTGILAATIKHIAEDNPIELTEATGRFLIETIKCYITSPFSRIISSAFIITAAIIIVSAILLEKLILSPFQNLHRWDEEQPKYRELRKEKVQRECEQQLEREEAEWRRRKDEVIRDRPKDVESFEYISGHPEEF